MKRIPNKQSCTVRARRFTMKALKEMYRKQWNLSTAREFGRFFDANVRQFWKSDLVASTHKRLASDRRLNPYDTLWAPLTVSAGRAYINHKKGE